MAAAMSWLEDLKYVWECSECRTQEIAVNRPTCCGEAMFLMRCAESVMNVQSDSIGDVRNPVDGKVYDSKAAYHRKLKETGHHVYEGKPSGKKVLDRGNHNVTKELKEAAEKAGL